MGSDLKFQINIPTVVAPVIVFFDGPDDSNLVEAAYERALLAELTTIADSLPHEEISIQADITFEIAHWEGMLSPYYPEDAWTGTIRRITRFAECVPASVDFVVHLCYGDYQHKHFMPPKDLGVLTEMANASTRGWRRRIVHFHRP